MEKECKESSYVIKMHIQIGRISRFLTQTNFQLNVKQRIAYGKIVFFGLKG